MLVEPIDTKDKNIVFVYTTCASRTEARSMAESVISERLAVCVDFWDVESVYPWQGVVQDVNQCMALFTTQKAKAIKLMKFIESIHSYTVPVIAECDVNIATQAYKFWIEETLESNQDYLSIQEAIESEKREEDAKNGIEKLK